MIRKALSVFDAWLDVAVALAAVAFSIVSRVR